MEPTLKKRNAYSNGPCGSSGKQSTLQAREPFVLWGVIYNAGRTFSLKITKTLYQSSQAYKLSPERIALSPTL